MNGNITVTMGFINGLLNWLLNARGKMNGIFLGETQENTSPAPKETANLSDERKDLRQTYKYSSC